MTDTYWCV